MSIKLNDFLAEYELKGWIIEWRHEIIYKDNNDKVVHSRWTGWSRHWNNKIYLTKEAAEKAINYTPGYWVNTEIRYRPLYSKLNQP